MSPFSLLIFLSDSRWQSFIRWEYPKAFYFLLSTTHFAFRAPDRGQGFPPATVDYVRSQRWQPERLYFVRRFLDLLYSSLLSHVLHCNVGELSSLLSKPYFLLPTMSDWQPLTHLCRRNLPTDHTCFHSILQWILPIFLLWKSSPLKTLPPSLTRLNSVFCWVPCTSPFKTIGHYFTK